MPFTFNQTPIQGLFVIQPRVFEDERGFFLENYKESDFANAGIVERFVQDNHSRSTRGVLRGIHFQKDPHAQGKLVRVTRGAVWDVAVDLRKDSTTLGNWFGVELSESNRTLFYIPRGFGHAFVTLSDYAELQYKCTAEYNKEADAGLHWDDPDLRIEWPVSDVLVSQKDAGLPTYGAFLRA